MSRLNLNEKSLIALQALAISLIPKKEVTEESAAEVPVLSEDQKRAVRVRGLIKAHYPPEQSGHSKAISHICAALLGVDVKETLVEFRTGEKVNIKKGTALMVIGNCTRHCYQKGRVVFAFTDRNNRSDTECVAVIHDDAAEEIGTGNTLGLPGGEYGEDSRYATEAEIIEEIGKMSAILMADTGIGF